MDCENAFHNASRKAMLDAILRDCPHMGRLFWMGYCSHSSLVLMRRGRQFAVLHSQEGSRMGDKFGSFAYCLAVHPAYLAIQARCPRVVFNAATDDLKCYARDPVDLCNMFPVAAEELERHASVTLNASKSGILLAPGVADPALDRLPEGSILSDEGGARFLLIGAGRHKVQLKRDGLVVVGAAVGTDEFVSEHIMGVVRCATRKLDALTLVDAQSALLLLSGCLAQALSYHLQVTPPRLAAAAAAAWDAAMDAARARILCDPAVGRTPAVGPDLQALSDAKARLPLKMRGLGQTSATLLSPIAFYAAYTQHAYAEQGCRTRLLRAELDHALQELQLRLPALGLELLTQPDDLGTAAPPLKLQRDLTRLAHSLAQTRLKDSARDQSDVRVLECATDAFLPFLVAPTEHGLVISHADYISGLRLYLLLPQLLRMPTAPVLVAPPAPGAPDLSYEADACRHCRGRHCDRHLSHAHACAKSSKPKAQDRHDMVRDVRAELVKAAGYTRTRTEARLNYSTQRRGDVSFVDETRHVHFHYITDDVIVHPLCPTHIGTDPLELLAGEEKKKERDYSQPLALLRTAQACVAGLRKVVFRACAFSSLGELSRQAVKFINAAAGFAKQRADEQQRLHPRDDGLTPQQVAKRFRFRARALIQAAILSGNALIASTAGL